MTTPTPQITPNQITPDYYEFNECSGEWHNWSVSKISCQTWYLVPVGLIGLVASTALRIVEGTFMLLANACLFIKYLCVTPPSQTPAPPAQDVPAPQNPARPIVSAPTVPQRPPANPSPMNPPPALQPFLLPMNPAPMNPPPSLPLPINGASANQPLLLQPPINPAPANQPDPVRGCGTRVQAHAATRLAAIKENPKPAITVATGILAAGASFAYPPLMPLAIGITVYKLAEMHFTKNKNS